MSASILGFQAPLLRAIADQLGLKPISEIAQLPGVTEVYRITVHYFDGRACNSVATLHAAQTGEIVLEIAYEHALARKSIAHVIDLKRWEDFVQAVKSLSFDRMRDQPNLPAYHSTDLWLVERAAGTFSHSVILAPEIASEATPDHYARLVNAVRHGLPEALRQVK